MSRKTLFPGKDKPQTFTLQVGTKAKLAVLATAAGCSQSDFVNGLVERYGPQLAAELLAVAQEGPDGKTNPGDADRVEGGQEGGMVPPQ